MQGKIWVYDVGEQLALPQPDEWNKFAYALHDIKNNQTEDDFDTKMASMGSMSSGAASMMHPSLMASMPPGVGSGDPKWARRSCADTSTTSSP